MPAGLLAFLIALLASLTLTVPVRALALRVGMVDLPGPRKVHLSPIPLLGGLAMYGAVVLVGAFYVRRTGTGPDCWNLDGRNARRGRGHSR